MPLVLASPRLPAASRAPSGGRGRPPRHLADLPLAERRAVVAGLGQPPFRASQLSRHFFGRYTDRPEEMSDLPLAARDPLAQALLPRLLTPERELSLRRRDHPQDAVAAFDGALVESVLMRYPDRVTMCVSSQAGCGMACPFCATGQAGLTRNLSTAEIVAQVVAGARMLADGEVPGGPGRVSNVVFMGMGEPLANYASVAGRGAPADRPGAGRHGHLPAFGHGLHGGPGAGHHTGWPTKACRSPWPCPCTPRTTSCATRWCRSTRRWKVAEVLDAAWAYAATTGRRVSIEYALIRDINDQPGGPTCSGRCWPGGSPTST